MSHTTLHQVMQNSPTPPKVPLKQIIKHQIILISLLAISACSTQPNTHTAQQTQQPIPDHWNITAKLGIRTQDDSGSLTLRWTQKGEHYHIQASGPLGQGRVAITGQKHQIMMKRPNQPASYSSHPEQLLEDTLGWQFPIQQLGYWVRGLPYPENNRHQNNTVHNDETEYHWDTSGTLTALVQSGWHLEYDRYQLIDNWLLPKKIKARKENVVLTLIIKQWQLNRKK